MAESESILTVKLTAKDREIRTISSWSISSNYLVATDEFSFTAYDSTQSNLWYLETQPVELFVNGQQQLVGRIDKTSMGGKRGQEVEFTGRDFIADLKECNVDPTVIVKDGDSIGAVFTLAASVVGIDSVVSDDDIVMRNVRSGIFVKRGKSAKAFHKKELKEYKPRKGEGLYEFFLRLIARFGATIQAGPDRSTLVITAPRYDTAPIGTLYRYVDPIQSGRNNVSDSSADRDFSSFPSFTLGIGKANQGADASTSAINLALDTFAFASALAGADSELVKVLAEGTLAGRQIPGKAEKAGLDQLYRLLWVSDQEARTQDQLDFSVRRALAERLKETLVYTCVVRGHTDPKTGAIWSVDTMVNVEDDVCNVHEALWIAERELSYNETDGAMTRMTCYRPGSFQLGEAGEAA